MTMWPQRLAAMLAHRGIDCVLDVGAHEGGYGEALYSGGYRGQLISFEPQPGAWRTLKARAAASGRLWSAMPPMALSDAHGEAVFHVAGNSTSSSLLAMGAAHRAAAPHSVGTETITVATRKLDDLLELTSMAPRFFLKLDVQGAERKVLDGAARALAEQRIAGLQLEMSIGELYEGQATARELDDWLRGQGFACFDMIPGFRDADTLQLMQYDGVYFRD